MLIISYMKLANSKYFVLWHVFQKVLNLIFLLFPFRFLFIRVMRIEILHAFKRVESIHETQTPSLFLNNYQLSLICNAPIKGGSRTAAAFKVELLVIIVNGFRPLTIITKNSTLDVAAVLDPPLPILTWRFHIKKWMQYIQYDYIFFHKVVFQRIEFSHSYLMVCVWTLTLWKSICVRVSFQ